MCVVELRDVCQSVGRCHERELSVGIEYISNVHTFRRAKIRCRAIFTTYSHTYRHLEHTAKPQASQTCIAGALPTLVLEVLLDGVVLGRVALEACHARRGFEANI